MASYWRANNASDEAATIGQIAKQLDQRPGQLRPVLVKLIEDGAVKKTGERRGTRYSVR